MIFVSDRSSSARLWKLSGVIPVFGYRIGLGSLVGHIILLLTTTGRRSGQEHTTPIQYELVDGQYIIGSARGTSSDWFRNILANPEVWIHVKSMQFPALATPITKLDSITDFLELRFMRHPIMMGMLFRIQGWSSQPTRRELQAYARRRSLVKITPKEQG